MADEESGRGEPRAFEHLTPGQVYERVSGREAWIDLAYVDGLPEFTVVQVTLMGDYRVHPDQLRWVLEYVDRIVVKRLGPLGTLEEKTGQT